MSKPYLFLYNIASTLGWAYVLYITITSFPFLTSKQYFDTVSPILNVVQCAALLEIVHSLFKLVRSPLLTTVVQVFSRVYVLALMNATDSGEHWSVYLTVLSWSLVEVPRYLFYALNLFSNNVPYPLFWLRYTLFMILYPSGITGEILQNIKALSYLKHHSVLAWYLVLFILLLYIPGSPFMYYHMLVQRKNQFMLYKGRSARTAPVVASVPNGIEFPADPVTGERGTTAVNKGAFAAAASVFGKEEENKVNKERDWRFQYYKHVIRHVQLCAGDSEACVLSAQKGLDYLHNTFEFVREGKTYKLDEAMNTIKKSYETGVIEGTKNKEKKEYVVPYKNYLTTQMKELSGKDLLAQLEKWAAYGTIEPEARDYISAVVEHPEWLDLSDYYFVLLGAGAAMGPLHVLLSLGANVVAIDIDRPVVWSRLINLARDSPGKIVFPLSSPQSSLQTEEQLFAAAGCNLFTNTPEIANWLNSCPLIQGKKIVVGGYAYMDGALHVKAALAMDAIMKSICASRPSDQVSLAFLCTPTDCHLVPKAAQLASKTNFNAAPAWQQLLSKIPGGLQQNRNIVVTDKKNNEFYIVDALVVEQGPNYALAKRMQHWRAIVAHSQGIAVSSNVAPSTATASVVHNAQFAAAYGGMHYFKPMEVMNQETSNAVMGALLLHDIRNPDSPARKPASTLNNPLELFSYGGFHGGIWRCGFKFNRVGMFAALAYYVKFYRLYVFAAVGGLAAFIGYVIQNGPPHTW